MTSQNAIVAGYGDHRWAEVTNPQGQGGLIDRAFLTAHLLTGDSVHAERAMMEAIASWGPDQSEDELFARVLHATVRDSVDDVPSRTAETDLADASLPAEFQAVLSLEPQLRRCYVLRVLVGLPRHACASMLGLSMQQVDRHTCAALRCLPLLAQPASARTEYAA
jgi:hypothetical protein